jgi:hypothetical protein
MPEYAVIIAGSGHSLDACKGSTVAGFPNFWCGITRRFDIANYATRRGSL